MRYGYTQDVDIHVDQTHEEGEDDHLTMLAMLGTVFYSMALARYLEYVSGTA